MPTLDPLAVRVALRYLAKVERCRRIAIEYQRRSWGLERVEHEGDDGGPEEARQVADDDHPQ